MEPLKGLTSKDRQEWDKTYSAQIKKLRTQGQTDADIERAFRNTKFKEAFGNRSDYNQLMQMSGEERDAFYNQNVGKPINEVSTPQTINPPTTSKVDVWRGTITQQPTSLNQVTFTNPFQSQSGSLDMSSARGQRIVSDALKQQQEQERIADYIEDMETRTGLSYEEIDKKASEEARNIIEKQNELLVSPLITGIQMFRDIANLGFDELGIDYELKGFREKRLYNKIKESYIDDNFKISDEDNPYKNISTSNDIKASMPFISSLYNKFQNHPWLPPEEIDWDELYNKINPYLKDGRLLKAQKEADDYFNEIIGKHQPLIGKTDEGFSKLNVFASTTGVALLESMTENVTAIPSIAVGMAQATFNPSEFQLDNGFNWFYRSLDNAIHNDWLGVFSNQSMEDLVEEVTNNKQIYGNTALDYILNSGYTVGASVGQIVPAVLTAGVGTAINKTAKSAIKAAERAGKNAIAKQGLKALDLLTNNKSISNVILGISNYQEAINQVRGDEKNIIDSGRTIKFDSLEDLYPMILDNPDSYYYNHDDYIEAMATIPEEWREYYLDLENGKPAVKPSDDINEEINVLNKLELNAKAIHLTNLKAPDYDETIEAEARRKSVVGLGTQWSLLFFGDKFFGGFDKMIVDFATAKKWLSPSTLSNQIKGDFKDVTAKSLTKKLGKTAWDVTKTGLAETATEIGQQSQSAYSKQVAEHNLENYLNAHLYGGGSELYANTTLLAFEDLDRDEFEKDAALKETILQTLLVTPLMPTVGYSGKIKPGKARPNESKLANVIENIHYYSPVNTYLTNSLFNTIEEHKAVKDYVNHINNWYSNPENNAYAKGTVGVADFSLQVLKSAINNDEVGYNNAVFNRALSEAVMLSNAPNSQIAKNRLTMLNNMANIKSATNEQQAEAIKSFREELQTNPEVAQMSDGQILDTIEKNGKSIVELYNKVINENAKLDAIYGEGRLDWASRSALLFGKFAQEDLQKRMQSKEDVISDIANKITNEKLGTTTSNVNKLIGTNKKSWNVSGQDILKLEPTLRSYMLNPANLEQFNNEQQKIIEDTRAAIIANSTTDTLGLIRQIADEYRQNDIINKEYRNTLKSPERVSNKVNKNNEKKIKEYNKLFKNRVTRQLKNANTNAEVRNILNKELSKHIDDENYTTESLVNSIKDADVKKKVSNIVELDKNVSTIREEIVTTSELSRDLKTRFSEELDYLEDNIQNPNDIFSVDNFSLEGINPAEINKIASILSNVLQRAKQLSQQKSRVTENKEVPNNKGSMPKANNLGDREISTTPPVNNGPVKTLKYKLAKEFVHSYNVISHRLVGDTGYTFDGILVVPSKDGETIVLTPPEWKALNEIQLEELQIKLLSTLYKNKISGYFIKEVEFKEYKDNIVIPITLSLENQSNISQQEDANLGEPIPQTIEVEEITFGSKTPTKPTFSQRVRGILDESSKLFTKNNEVNRTAGYYTDNTGRRFLRLHSLFDKNFSIKSTSLSEVFTNNAIQRGNAFDVFCRYYFLTSDFEGAKQAALQELESIDDEGYKITEEGFNNIKQFCDNLLSQGYNIITNNLIVHGEFNGLRLAGDMDILLEKDGILYVADFKASRHSPKNNLDYRTQLAFYKDCLKQMGVVDGTDIKEVRTLGFIHLKANNTVELEEVGNLELSNQYLAPYSLWETIKNKINADEATKAELDKYKWDTRVTEKYNIEDGTGVKVNDEPVDKIEVSEAIDTNPSSTEEREETPVTTQQQVEQQPTTTQQQPTIPEVATESVTKLLARDIRLIEKNIAQYIKLNADTNDIVEVLYSNPRLKRFLEFIFDSKADFTKYIDSIKRDGYESFTLRDYLNWKDYSKIDQDPYTYATQLWDSQFKESEAEIIKRAKSKVEETIEDTDSIEYIVRDFVTGLRKKHKSISIWLNKEKKFDKNLPLRRGLITNRKPNRDTILGFDQAAEQLINRIADIRGVLPSEVTENAQDLLGDFIRAEDYRNLEEYKRDLKKERIQEEIDKYYTERKERIDALYNEIVNNPGGIFSSSLEFAPEPIENATTIEEANQIIAEQYEDSDPRSITKVAYVRFPDNSRVYSYAIRDEEVTVGDFVESKSGTSRGEIINLVDVDKYQNPSFSLQDLAKYPRSIFIKKEDVATSTTTTQPKQVADRDLSVEINNKVSQNIYSNRTKKQQERVNNNITPAIEEIRMSDVSNRNLQRLGNKNYSNIEQILDDNNAFEYQRRGFLTIGDEVFLAMTMETLDNGIERPITWICTKPKGGFHSIKKGFEEVQILNILDSTEIQGARKEVIDNLRKKFDENKTDDGVYIDYENTYTVNNIQSGDVVTTTNSNPTSEEVINSTNLKQNLAKNSKGKYGFHRRTTNGTNFVRCILYQKKTDNRGNIIERITNSSVNTNTIEEKMSSNNVMLLVPTPKNTYLAKLPVYIMKRELPNALEVYRNSLINGSIGKDLKERIIKRLNDRKFLTSFSDYFTFPRGSKGEYIYWDTTKGVMTLGYTIQSNNNTLLISAKQLTKNVNGIELASGKYVIVSPLNSNVVLNDNNGEGFTFDEVCNQYFESLLSDDNFNLSYQINMNAISNNGNILDNLIEDGVLWAPNSLPGRLRFEGSTFTAPINPKESESTTPTTITPSITPTANVIIDTPANTISTNSVITPTISTQPITTTTPTTTVLGTRKSVPRKKLKASDVSTNDVSSPSTPIDITPTQQNNTIVNYATQPFDNLPNNIKDELIKRNITSNDWASFTDEQAKNTLNCIGI